MQKYRQGAGIVLLNAESKVLLCQRLDFTDQWQFPQGGIEDGETPKDAAKRELFEETSVRSARFVAQAPVSMRYEFPEDIKDKFVFAGQDIHWFLFYFTGDDTEINLNTDTPEFRSYKWVDIDDSLEKIVFFKKSIYKQMIEYFKPILEDYNG